MYEWCVCLYSQYTSQRNVISDRTLCPVCLQPFGNILNLVPLAESVVKLNAVCMQCYKEAAYTKRLGAEKEVRERGYDLY